MSKVCTGVVSFLATLFIMLKITGEISRPWVWVLAPLWFPFAVAFIAVVSALGVAALKGLWEASKHEN